MDPDYLKLLGLHRREFEFAKRDQATSRKFYAGVFLFGVLSVLIKQTSVVYIHSLLAFLSTSIGSFFIWRSQKRHASAERGRRAVLLMKGLSWSLSKKEKTDLLGSFTASKLKTEQWEDNNYFTATGSSYKELAKLIQESAFWSKYLYWENAKSIFFSFLLWVTFLGALLFLLPFLDKARSFEVAQVVSFGLMFLVTFQMLWQGILCLNASQQSENIDARLEHIISSGFKEPDVIAVFGDYNAITLNAPLIPTKIYKKNQDRLNELWDKRIGACV